MNNKFWYYSIPKINIGRFLFYFITLAALAVIYLKFSELKLIGSLFAASNYLWLSAIIIIQFFVYYFQALNYHYVLKIKDLEVQPKELYPMSFVVQFLNQALPTAGLSGQVFFIQYLRKYGLTVPEGIGRAFLEVMTLWMAVGSFFIASSVIILRGGAIADVPELRYVIYFFAFLAVIAVSVFFLIQRRKRSGISKWIINWFHRNFERRRKLKDGKIVDHSEHVEMIFDQLKSSINFRFLQTRVKSFWLAFLWQCMIILANIITLYLISFAIGHPISFLLAFIIFSLVRFIQMVSFVPGALGVFEGSMVLILISFGVAASPALAMTLLLRAFTFWFPMPIGWAIYRWYSLQYKFENFYDRLNKES